MEQNKNDNEKDKFLDAMDRMMIKTHKEWEKSNKPLNEFLNHPCEIDEALYLHICEMVAPSYSYLQITQSGEATREIDNVIYYKTVYRVNNKYYYLGILPEFKHPE